MFNSLLHICTSNNLKIEFILQFVDDKQNVDVENVNQIQIIKAKTWKNLEIFISPHKTC